MHETRSVTEDQLRAVRLVGWVYIILGAVIVATRVVAVVATARRMISHLSRTGDYHTWAMVAMLGLFALVVIVLGGVLIGGGIGLLKRQEGGRLALLVGSWILLPLSLLRSLQVLPSLVLMPRMGSAGSHGSEAFREAMHHQLTAAGASLLLAILLGVLLALLTGPALTGAVLPGRRPVVPPPPVEQQT